MKYITLARNLQACEDVFLPLVLNYKGEENESEIQEFPALYIIMNEHHLVINPFSAGTDFRRQNLTSKVAHRTERI